VHGLGVLEHDQLQARHLETHLAYRLVAVGEQALPEGRIGPSASDDAVVGVFGDFRDAIDAPVRKIDPQAGTAEEMRRTHAEQRLMTGEQGRGPGAVGGHGSCGHGR